MWHAVAMIQKYLPAVALVISLGALAAAGTFYFEGQRTYRKLSADIAQVKVSLTLLTQRAGAGGESETIQAIQNRLAVLEENWRNPQTAAPSPTPEAPAQSFSVAPSADQGATGPSTDCIPAGTAFVMTEADSYAICGTKVVIAFASISQDAAVLDNGIALAKGLASPLPDSSCKVSLVSADAETGFAELRVTC